MFSKLIAVAVLAMSCLSGATFWSSTTVPLVGQVSNDSASVNLGLRFTSDVAGNISGVRFYKGSRNTGTHTGALWTSTGTRLAVVTFANETASGWQQANFAAPVSIKANTVYVVSYRAPRGNYACDQQFAWSSLNRLPLRPSGTSPGVYAYSSSTVYPGSSWNRSNYYVDVVFNPAAPPPPPATYTISGTVSGTAATLTLSGAAGKTTATDGAGNYSFMTLAPGNYVVAPSASGFTFTPSTRAVTITAANAAGVNFAGTANPVPIPHRVELSWDASTTETVTGYNVYRASIAGGTFVKMNSAPIAGRFFTDAAVESGRTYYYAVTAVSPEGESAGSNQATAVVPFP